ncbi:glycoside hydrolase family 97 protein [Pelagicoccus mobilis]|uniref:Glycoside hydrolase family 97 protein n=1 Tax=Pelagicoccus mobilis TaxID=415221 RepID=A0A934RYS7_9BACT|nr:glycoside hydrolase family 97 protein [Pelagicoccus mobilis]MBK1879086.1 glycoside hydrolase family 97 protein [Pelagicoccus mobilis]
MKSIALSLAFASAFLANAATTLTSPDGNITLSVEHEKGLSFSLATQSETLIHEATPRLTISGDSPFDGKSTAARNHSHQGLVTPPLPLKNSQIADSYNALTLEFGNEFSVEFRAFDDGVAYRFLGKRNAESEINESLSYTFTGDNKLWTSVIEGYTDSFEVPYTEATISEFGQYEHSYLPLLAATAKGTKLLFTDADIYDYPHMFLKKGKRKNQLIASFPPYPLETELVGDRGSKITKAAKYIAKTNANRSFPWRVITVAEEDATLIESELVYLLSRDGQNTDTSWIEPGKVAWDWWNAMNLYDVDFKTGLNTETWNYYIDFAAEHGIEYVILDEGWSITTTDLTRSAEDLDLEALMAHAKAKDVKIILWTTWRALEANWDILDQFKAWGASGIKVDFMDRMDQWMVNFYEKAARETYDRQLLIDFHGAFKPTGLRRQYPNVISYEGVTGLEQSKWSKKNTPSLNATIPFIRMVCGPMDYTPGAMRNFLSTEFESNFYRPASQGTRCHQVALFVLYESALQMMADSPSNYMREAETTEFLAKIPTTWHELKVIDAHIGETLALARRHEDTWYVAGITNEDAREVEVDFSFLGQGTFTATIMEDGINAATFAEDYQKRQIQVTANDTLTLKMSAEGGFAIRID